MPSLFDLPALAAQAERLPLSDRTFDAAWSLGVLCTIREKAEESAELGRV